MTRTLAAEAVIFWRACRIIRIKNHPKSTDAENILRDFTRTAHPQIQARAAIVLEAITNEQRTRTY